MKTLQCVDARLSTTQLTIAFMLTARGTGTGRSAGLTPVEVKEMNGNWSNNMVGPKAYRPAQ
jgi:hypothetical protein